MFFRFDVSNHTVAGEIVLAGDRLVRQAGRAPLDAADFAIRFGRAVAEIVGHRLINGINWSGDFIAASEASSGTARLGLVIRFSGPGFDLARGHLIGFVNAGSAFPFRQADLERLFGNGDIRPACAALAAVTPASYLAIWAPATLKLVRADTAAASDATTLPEVYHQDVAGFFNRALMGWSGDGAIAAGDPGAIQRLISAHRLAGAIVLRAHDGRAD